MSPVSVDTPVRLGPRHCVQWAPPPDWLLVTVTNPNARTSVRTHEYFSIVGMVMERTLGRARVRRVASDNGLDCTLCY